MGLYRKKPVVVEATQWFKLGDHPDVIDYHAAYDLGYRNSNPETAGVASISNNYEGKGLIQTLEGWHEVTPSDWIITGVSGEKYPCKHDIFEKTYEEAFPGAIIFINGKKCIIEEDSVSYTQVLRLAGIVDTRKYAGVPGLGHVVYTVTWATPNNQGCLVHGERVNVEGGMVFNAGITGNA